MNPDLRDFLRKIEDEDPGSMLKVGRETALDFEMTAYAFELEKQNSYPLLFFDKISGYPHRVVSNIFATRRLFAQILGVPPEHLLMEWIRRSTQEMEPARVSSAPVEEKVVTGSDVDLRTLPIPVHFNEDAGPYVTAGIVVAKHPHTGVRNASLHRLQLKGKNRMGISLHSRRHLWEYQRLAEEKEEPLEVAVFIGAHPLVYLGTGLWKGSLEMDEYRIAGGFLGEPLEIIDCRTVNLEVPATSEVVLEGRILPGVREDEGPFGEFTGYASKNSTRHVFEVTAILQRKDAIFQEIVPGMSAEHTLLVGVPQEATIFERVRSIVPTLKNVAYPSSGACRLHVYMSMRKTAEGQPANAIFTAFSEDLSLKLAIVVDEDIDVHDEREVMWAVATRFQADRNLFVVPRCMGAMLDPSSNSGLTAKMGIDTTKPLEGWWAERCTVPVQISGTVRQLLG